MTTVDNQLEHLVGGCEGVYSRQELGDKLAAAKPLRIKLGMDPTAPDIHLGHAVVLRKLRQFQDLGHRAVLIIGDYTAKVGDPSGRDSTRPVLDDATITANAQTYLQQAGKILDTSPEKLEVRRNSEWLGKLSFADVLRLTGLITVQQMLHRENFRLRMQRQAEIVVSEFMYPLMQAYDSVVIGADVELGGTDQTFNCLCGRELMAKHDLARQVVLVLPLLVGLDGHDKMSKSKGNYVGLTDAPDQMFGKVMSLPDTLMGTYYRLLTPVPEGRVQSLLDPRQTHPREAKDTLARVIVEMMYDLQTANAASAEFTRRFSEKQLPSDVETKRVAVAGPMRQIELAELMVDVGFASSKSEARRLIQQGAVTFGGSRQTEPTTKVGLPSEGVVLLKVGKRRVCQVARA